MSFSNPNSSPNNPVDTQGTTLTNAAWANLITFRNAATKGGETFLFHLDKETGLLDSTDCPQEALSARELQDFLLEAWTFLFKHPHLDLEKWYEGSSLIDLRFLVLDKLREAVRQEDCVAIVSERPISEPSAKSGQNSEKTDFCNTVSQEVKAKLSSEGENASINEPKSSFPELGYIVHDLESAILNLELFVDVKTFSRRPSTNNLHFNYSGVLCHEPDFGNRKSRNRDLFLKQLLLDRDVVSQAYHKAEGKWLEGEGNEQEVARLQKILIGFEKVMLKNAGRVTEANDGNEHQGKLRLRKGDDGCTLAVYFLNQDRVSKPTYSGTEIVDIASPKKYDPLLSESSTPSHPTNKVVVNAEKQAFNNLKFIREYPLLSESGLQGFALMGGRVLKLGGHKTSPEEAKQITQQLVLDQAVLFRRLTYPGQERGHSDPSKENLLALMTSGAGIFPSRENDEDAMILKQLVKFAKFLSGLNKQKVEQSETPDFEISNLLLKPRLYVQGGDRSVFVSGSGDELTEKQLVDRACMNLLVFNRHKDPLHSPNCPSASNLRLEGGWLIHDSDHQLEGGEADTIATVLHRDLKILADYSKDRSIAYEAWLARKFQENIERARGKEKGKLSSLENFFLHPTISLKDPNSDFAQDDEDLPEHSCFLFDGSNGQAGRAMSQKEFHEIRYRPPAAPDHPPSLPERKRELPERKGERDMTQAQAQAQAQAPEQEVHFNVSQDRENMSLSLDSSLFPEIGTNGPFELTLNLEKGAVRSFRLENRAAKTEHYKLIPITTLKDPAGFSGEVLLTLTLDSASAPKVNALIQTSDRARAQANLKKFNLAKSQSETPSSDRLVLGEKGKISFRPLKTGNGPKLVRQLYQDLWTLCQIGYTKLSNEERKAVENFLALQQKIFLNQNNRGDQDKSLLSLANYPIILLKNQQGRGEFLVEDRLAYEQRVSSGYYRPQGWQEFCKNPEVVFSP